MATDKTSVSKKIEFVEETKQTDEQKTDETVDFVSQIFASRLNATLTSIGKFAMDWIVWNTTDNIYWNFDIKQNNNNDKKYIAFTMDDSPGLGLNGTIEFLDFLKEENIQITFFLISSMIRDPHTKELNPAASKVIDRMISDGHELGNHSVFDEKLININETEYEYKTSECEEMICLFDKQFGDKNKIKWYRPPSGIMTKLHYDILTKKGYKIAMANKYGRDTRNCKNTKYLYDFYTNDVNNGDIMIIHTPDEKRDDRYSLLNVIKKIILKLKQDGFILTTLSNVYEQSKN